MSVPTNNLDANGLLLQVGYGVAINGKITSFDGAGNCVIQLSDAYDTLASQLQSATIPCYNVRQAKTSANA
jgi:hypothetical protein